MLSSRASVAASASSSGDTGQTQSELPVDYVEHPDRADWNDIYEATTSDWENEAARREVEEEWQAEWPEWRKRRPGEE